MREPSWPWLVLGCFGLLLATAVIAVDFESYARHQHDSDQAGYMLGLMFLNVWILPPTAAVSLLGSNPGGARAEIATRTERVLLVGFEIALRVGALVVAAAAWHYWSHELRGSPSIVVEGAAAASVFHRLYAAVVFGYAGVLWGCSGRLRTKVERSSRGSSTWIVLTALVGIVVVLLILSETTHSLSQSTHSAQSGSTWLPLMVQNTLIVATPTLLFSLIALRTARLLWRRPLRTS